MTADPAAADTWTPEWTLGDRLRKIRRHLGVSQIEFAVTIEQNPKSYSSWESDQAQPRQLVAVAKRIEVATGVPAVWLLGIEPTQGRTVITQEYWAGSGATIVEFPQLRATSWRYAATDEALTDRDHTCESSDIA